MAENKRGRRPPRRKSTPKQEVGAILESRNGQKKPNNQGDQEPGDTQGEERAARRTPGGRRRTRPTQETPVTTSGQQEAVQPEPEPMRPEQAQEPAEAPLAPRASEDETPPEMAGVAVGAESAEPAEEVHRERHRVSQNNALGMLIEQHFEDPTSPCRSYSDLERRSRISREALSRYVTNRPDRRRSPTIDSLVAIADAMHLSLESVCRAAAAAAKGVIPPPEDVQQTREELVRPLIAALGDEQFSAVVELLIQMRPLGPGSSGSRRPIPQL